jgi:hypothetical protein
VKKKPDETAKAAWRERDPPPMPLTMENAAPEPKLAIILQETKLYT